MTLLLVCGMGLVASSFWLQGELTGLARWSSWAMLVVGIMVFMVGIRASEGKMPRVLESTSSRLQTWLGVKDWQLILLAISPVLAYIASQAAGTGQRMEHPVMAILAWLAGMGLALVGGWQFTGNRRPFPKPVMIMAGLLFLVAFTIRIVGISRIPIVLSGDEASAGLSAVEFINGTTDNIFRVGWFSFPSFYFFIQSIPIAVLGRTIAALRVSSVIVGALTVGGVYLMARAMFGEWTALFSALFLAVFHFHNNFSRIGLNNIWDGLWFTVVLGALWYGWHKERRAAVLLAGLALGLSQYFYVSARLLFALVPAWVLLAGLFDRQRLKRSLPDLSLMGVVALVTVLPLALFFVQFPDEFSAPMRRVSILGSWMANEVNTTGQQPWQIVLHQIGLSFQGFAHIPIRMWYQPGTPLLLPLPATLFFLGIVLMLLKLRDSRTFLFGLWLISFGIAGGLSESTPAAQRYVAVAPAVAIVVGYGLARSAALLGNLWVKQKRWINALAMASIALVCLNELNFYFLDYVPRSDFGGDNSIVAQHLADYLRTKNGEWEVLFFGAPRMGYFSISSLPYLDPQILGTDINNPWGSPDNPKPSRSNLIFVFLPNHEDDLKRIQMDYPSGKLVTEYGYYAQSNHLLYWLYEVPAANDKTAAPLPDKPAGSYPIASTVSTISGVYP